MGDLAVLLRDGPQDGAAGTITKYALKCSDVAISIAKTPIQIPIPQQSPELIDIGYFRPSITITGLVDTVGGNLSNTTNGYAGMSSLTITRTSVNGSSWSDGGSANAQTYYIPYKNALEQTAVKWIYSDANQMELEIGDSKFPIASEGGGYVGASGSSIYHNSFDSQFTTGGAIYRVAIQQARFQINAGREDRYDFTMQFIAESRVDIV